MIRFQGGFSLPRGRPVYPGNLPLTLYKIKIFHTKEARRQNSKNLDSFNDLTEITYNRTNSEAEFLLNHNLNPFLLAHPKHLFIPCDFLGWSHRFVGVVRQFHGGASVGRDGFAHEAERRERVACG